MVYFGIVQLIVLGDVSVESAEQDHGHHSGEEEDNDDTVDDAEPLDLWLRHAVQNVVPPKPLTP